MAFDVAKIASVANPITAVSSGALDVYGAYRANKEAEEAAEKSMQFSASQAREQMAFQERMSSTAYQRAMEDMRKAGLNPMLAYSQGGASTPSGASGSGASYVPQNIFEGVGSSARDLSRTRAEVAERGSSKALKDLEAERTRWEVKTAEVNYNSAFETLRSQRIDNVERLFSMNELLKHKRMARWSWLANKLGPIATTGRDLALGAASVTGIGRLVGSAFKVGEAGKAVLPAGAVWSEQQFSDYWNRKRFR